MTVFDVFGNLIVSELHSMMFSYSEAVEIQRIDETAATPQDAEGASLSE